MNAAKLVLKTGECFHGLSPVWVNNPIGGEIVFNTSMVGYVEALTDPSYAGQILTFTYPLIGNYGVPTGDAWQSKKIQARGMVVSELADFHAHPDAKYSLYEWCEQQGLPIITGVDTRAVTKVLRHQGVVAGAITPADQPFTNFPNINDTNLVADVSITAPLEYGSGDKTVILVDCGMKTSILKCLQQYPIKIKRVPYNYDFTSEPYDGVLISNGPGDPQMCTETIKILQAALTNAKPMFGICLGSQLMALAIGAQTYKLGFGHRAQNHPCMDLTSGRCYLTSQNHGYSIKEDTLPNEWKVWFKHLNDDTVQGIRHQTLPHFAVQFHPEAMPGPVDTQWIFDKFYQTL